MSPKHRRVETCVEAKSRKGKYLQKIKVSDPERYKCHLAKEAARNKRARSKLSEEKKRIQREQTRLRAQKLRERRREGRQTEVRMQFQKKVKDMTHEERKEYDRVRKAESRAKRPNKRKEEFVKEKRNIERELHFKEETASETKN